MEHVRSLDSVEIDQTFSDSPTENKKDSIPFKDADAGSPEFPRNLWGVDQLPVITLQ